MDNEIFIVNGCKCLMRNFNKTYNTIHFEIQIIVLIPWQILDYLFVIIALGSLWWVDQIVPL